jgi:16S rRNA (cytosine967-C5)-methyltransferase
MNARVVALHLLRDFDKRPGDLSIIIDRGLRSKTIDRRDRRLVCELVYGTVRRRLTIDYVIEAFLSDTRIRANRELMRIMEVGVYQLLYMDKIPDHAAVNEAVNLAKNQFSTKRFSGVVNGVLRSVINAQGKLPAPGPATELVTRLSIEFSHPAWMVRRWLDRIGLAKVKKLLEFDNQVPDIFLRRKMRGITRQAFETESRTLAEAAGGYQNLFYRLVSKGIMPEEIALFEGGFCTVQAPSSGWAVAMLDIRPGDHCLDLCSAPGGKATLMAELSGERGSVVACDLKPGRLRRIRENAGRMELKTIYFIAADATMSPIRGMFDKVLLDAPCSGTGVVQRHPDARWTRTEPDIGLAAGLQAKLLDAAAPLIAPGGTLLYATCSLEPEENEEQVSAFLARHAEFILGQAPASVPAKYVNLEGILCISPYEHGMDGMYAARLIKKK